MRPWLLAAAAALATVAAAVFLVRRAPGPPPTAIERGAAEAWDLVKPSAGASLDRPPEELAWPAQDGADAYRVKIFTLSGSLVWESSAGPEARVALPPASPLRSGESYFWVVEVLPASGHRRLGPFRFSLR